MPARTGGRLRLNPVSPPNVLALERWIERLGGRTVVVWGDFMLDEYWRCLSRRVSREAPVLILDWQGRSANAGGAANAALNLAALGARTRAVGFVGADGAGHELRRLLEAAGVDTDGLLEHDHAPTVVKTRIVAGSVHTALQQVVRVDRGAPFPPAGSTKVVLSAALTEASRGAHAVVLSDYGYGSVTPKQARPWIRRWRDAGVVIALDARFSLAEYRGITLATPNESEASEAAGLAVRNEADLIHVAARLRRRTRAEALLITRGRDGLTWWDGRGGTSLEAWGGEEAVDVTGAGDAVVATATLALAAGAPPMAAAALANVAGSVAVSRRGTVAVTVRELRQALRRGARRVSTRRRSART